MDSGTENMDWIAAVLRRIIEFTQAGGELNVVVTGINVGAQPYWNAEATMLMHTRGILVMTPDSAMVLTGKQALDYSGGVSAEDNFGIGGYERIMGPNGQAQYWAPDLAGACRMLLRVLRAHLRRARRALPAPSPHRRPGRPRRPRRAAPGRRLRSCHASATSSPTQTNPGRKQPFDIRSVMRAADGPDHPPLERWAGMRDAETRGRVGRAPRRLAGDPARDRVAPAPALRAGARRRAGAVDVGNALPAVVEEDRARDQRGVRAARRLVVLANLAGFDGSPESMREWQLEFGAEIGRAVVNFDGPIVFCVVSRYHGGAFVVFSQQLNERPRTPWRSRARGRR